jgi:hypothetical protein
MRHHPAPVRVVAVLTQDPLQPTQHHPAFPDRDRQVHRRQRRPHVRRHVVRPLRRVLEQRLPVRYQPTEKPLEIRLHPRVRVVLDQQRCRRMTHMQRHHPQPR